MSEFTRTLKIKLIADSSEHADELAWDIAGDLLDTPAFEGVDSSAVIVVEESENV